MQLRGILVSVLAAGLLSACSTVDGAKKDFFDVDNWLHGQPSAMESTLGIGRVPTGYAGQNKRSVLKPPGMEIQQSAPAPETDWSAEPAASTPAAEWNTIEGYGENRTPITASSNDGIQSDLAPITSSSPPVHWDAAPAPAVVPQGSAYNKDVTVFPLDGEATSYNYTRSPYASAAPSAPATPSYDFYGQLVQQLYFVHGSSVIAQSDKKHLKELASGLKRTANDVSVTIIGHASKRVDGVSDPIEKKMVNFEMAQKRANAVTAELKKSGVNPAWVRTVSKGDDAPNQNPGTKSQEDADRRAEVYMDSK